MKTIIVKVKPDSSVELDMDGYAGDACQADLDRLMDFLKQQGLEVDVKELITKQEAYVGAATHETAGTQ